MMIIHVRKLLLLTSKKIMRRKSADVVLVASYLRSRPGGGFASLGTGGGALALRRQMMFRPDDGFLLLPVAIPCGRLYATIPDGVFSQPPEAVRLLSCWKLFPHSLECLS